MVDCDGIMVMRRGRPITGRNDDDRSVDPTMREADTSIRDVDTGSDCTDVSL